MNITPESCRRAANINCKSARREKQARWYRGETFWCFEADFSSLQPGKLQVTLWNWPEDCSAPCGLVENSQQQTVTQLQTPEANLFPPRHRTPSHLNWGKTFCKATNTDSVSRLLIVQPTHKRYSAATGPPTARWNSNPGSVCHKLPTVFTMRHQWLIVVTTFVAKMQQVGKAQHSRESWNKTKLAFFFQSFGKKSLPLTSI